MILLSAQKLSTRVGPVKPGAVPTTDARGHASGVSARYDTLLTTAVRRYYGMHMPDLEQDTTLRLPRVTVLKASAGSGKTFRLTQRYAQFLLSERIPRNQLRNLMAITFSNNASGEMRKNVLEWLKRLCLGDTERMREMEAVTAGGAERLSRRAGELIETILSRFSEFQVRTIDSFMASVFRASALDFGFGPDFEVVLDPQPLVDYAWNLFLRDARAGSPNARLLDRTIESVMDFKTSGGSFSWDPSTPLLAEIRKVEEKLSNMDETPILEDPGPRLKRFEQQVAPRFDALEELVRSSRLPPSATSTFERHLGEVQGGTVQRPAGRLNETRAR